jgi:F-type H+-transporting ATPase subunit b
MEIISTVALISINETLLVQLISFLLFLFLINRVMFRPLRKSIQDRDHHMENLAGEIAAAAKTIESIQEEIRQAEAATVQKAFRLRRRIDKEADQDVKAINQTGAKTVARLRQTAGEDLDRMMADARTRLEKESEGIAGQLMSSLLGRSVTP